MYDAVFINGTVGVGKTTTADVLSALLAERGVASAAIDVDGLRRLTPPPAGDRWATELSLANVAAVARNYREAGARVLVAAGVVEDARGADRYRDALGGGRMLLARLVVEPGVARQRLTERHASDPLDELEWHLDRQPELAGILDAADFAGELVIDATEATPREVAEHLARVILDVSGR
jgi:hypothetical protein